ncbi:MAG: hypothetical protein ACI901_000132, partial [Octadecabacter sp.]
MQICCGTGDVFPVQEDFIYCSDKLFFIVGLSLPLVAMHIKP